MNEYPDKIMDEIQLEELISRPGDKLVEMFSRIDGDVLFLGINGKIGPSLAIMAARACKKGGVKKRLMGVSRKIDDNLKKNLNNEGIETDCGDLLDRDFLKQLPHFKNVFFLAGMKFGAVDNPSLTWAINSYLPAITVEHFKQSKIVAFSTGCVYPQVGISTGGSVETDAIVATGEYAQSCLGRERMFEYGSNKYKTEVALIRLNYSVEMRYGVLVDIASKVKNNLPVDLTMGYFNVIWQGDMNDFVLRSLDYTQSPAKILNITGTRILSVREVALEFGRLFGKEPHFVGKEAETALLSNSEEAFRLFGLPKIDESLIVKWTAHWFENNGKLLGKSTHFEVRDGKY